MYIAYLYTYMHNNACTRMFSCELITPGQLGCYQVVIRRQHIVVTTLSTCDMHTIYLYYYVAI